MILLAVALSLLSFNQVIGQEITLKTGQIIEKRIVKGFSQTITVGNPRGLLQWQLSTDALAWSDMAGKTSNTLTVTVNAIIYLRCAIKEPICDIVYSDILKLIPFDQPIVTTAAVTNVSGTSATGGGTVVSDENSAILARGVCWATTHNPTTANAFTTDGLGEGAFVSNITGLTTNITYYVRAYASNLVGTSYGAEVSFSTSGTLPTVTTAAITAITNVTATGGGNVTNAGSSAVTARGVCWSLTANPTLANSLTTDGTGTGVFTSSLTLLTPVTTYYVRAYATNSSGTAYGAQVSFVTAANLPVVTTTPVTAITSNTAVSGGNVTSGGNATVTARGVCWAVTQNPTILNSKTTDATGIGVFVSTMTGLSPNTTYYVRAYATNSTGTSYGQEHTFTTRPAIPTVTTAAITNITNISAVGGGNVISDGNSPVTERGICWALTNNPTTAATKNIEGAGTGAFVSSLTGLTPNTTYYVRAYAINAEGTSYGLPVSFKTNLSVTPPTVTTAAITAITTTTATGGGNVTADGNSAVIARGVCWSTSEYPTTDSDTTKNGTGTGAFVSLLTGLTGNTTYYVRAYAINSFGKTYGEQITFKTLPSAPTVTTDAITAITSATATGGGNVTADGNSPILGRGICWSVASNPTVTDAKTVDGTGLGIFTSSITGLSPNVVYFVRAYAINAGGTSYGNEVFFTSLAGLPTLTTTAITDLTANTASSGGTITWDGSASITAKGVCWSTTAAPTITGSKTTDGTGTATFTSAITGLLPNTTYYLRSYATNSGGTGYGNELSFTTPKTLPAVTTTHISNITSSTAVGGGNVTDTGGDAATVKGVCWNTVTGPTISNYKTIDGTGAGPFTSSLSGLYHGATYYVRAYATNSVGTVYGNEVEFTAKPWIPTVETLTTSDLTATSVITGGHVINTGNGDITARGVCWSLTSPPTIDDAKTTDGTGEGYWVSSVTGLTSGTKYYIRAYATNAGGTGYGEVIEVTTL